MRLRNIFSHLDTILLCKVKSFYIFTLRNLMYTLPAMQNDQIIAFVSDGFEKAKSGDALNVYNSVCEIYRQGTLPERSHYPFGWIIYYALHQTPDNEIATRKQMLANYLRLKVTVPHKLHSMVLGEAIRLYRDAQNSAFGKRKEETVSFSILKFAELWNLDNLRPGDWKRKTIEDKTLSSMVEKLITVAADECENRQVTPPETLVKVVDRAIAEFPDSFSLYSQRGSLYDLAGDREMAKKMILKSLLLAPGKFFLWSKMATLIGVEDNPNLHIALLQRALKSPGPEQFKGKVRLALAKAFVALKAYPQALWELEMVKRTYEANGWHLSNTFNTLQRQIPANISATDPSDIYRKVDYLADELVYSEIPSVVMTKNYHKGADQNARFGKPAIAWRMADDEGNNVWFTPGKFGIDPNLPIGTRLHVKLHNGKVVKAMLTK